MAALKKEFYSREELAELLSVVPRTIDRWTKSGDLKAYKLGRVVRFRRDDIESFLKESKI